MRKCENPLIVLDSEVTAELQFSADSAKAGGEYLLQSGECAKDGSSRHVQDHLNTFS